MSHRQIHRLEAQASASLHQELVKERKDSVRRASVSEQSLIIEPWERRFTSVRDVFADFLARTSAHGMPHISESYTTCGRIFWIVVFAFCATAFCIQTYWTIDIYLSYKTTIEMQLLFEAAPFPAVTVCNLNPYKHSAVQKQPEITKMLEMYEQQLMKSRAEKLEVIASRDTRDVDRDKRQIHYQPYYARCACEDRINGSCRAVSNPEEGIKDCLCYFATETGHIWPCYEVNEWEETTCSWCSPILNSCTVPPRARAQNSSYREHCLCQYVSNSCVKMPKGKIPFYEPWKYAPTTADPTATTTPSPEETEAAGLNVLSDKGAITTKTKENVMFIVATYDREMRMNMSTTLREFVVSCSFNSKDCNMDQDFIVHVDPVFGNCYTFNYNQTQTVINSRAGPMYGLRMILNVNQDEYLQYTEAAGVRVVVHNQTDEPFPDTFGYSAPTGLLSSFGLKTKVVERRGHPYGECQRKDLAVRQQEDWIYEELYSVEGCYRNCFQHEMINRCGCGDPRFPLPKNRLDREHKPIKHCQVYNTDQRMCYENMTKSELSSFHQAKINCSCPQPCEETVYETAFAAAAWPAINHLLSDCPEELLADNDSSLCTAYYRKNTAHIEVYYEQLNFERLKEEPAYTMINLLADFGGNIGLWIGFSVITFVELLELCMELFYFCYYRGRKEGAKRRQRMGQNRLRHHMQYLSRFANMASAAASVHSRQETATLSKEEERIQSPRSGDATYRATDSAIKNIIKDTDM